MRASYEVITIKTDRITKRALRRWFVKKTANKNKRDEHKEEQALEVLEIPFKGFFYSFKGAHTLYLSEEEAREAGGLGVKRFDNARDAVAYALGIKGND